MTKEIRFNAAQLLTYLQSQGAQGSDRLIVRVEGCSADFEVWDMGSEDLFHTKAKNTFTLWVRMPDYAGPDRSDENARDVIRLQGELAERCQLQARIELAERLAEAVATIRNKTFMWRAGSENKSQLLEELHAIAQEALTAYRSAGRGES